MRPHLTRGLIVAIALTAMGLGAPLDGGTALLPIGLFATALLILLLHRHTEQGLSATTERKAPAPRQPEPPITAPCAGRTDAPPPPVVASHGDAPDPLAQAEAALRRAIEREKQALLPRQAALRDSPAAIRFASHLVRTAGLAPGPAANERRPYRRSLHGDGGPSGRRFPAATALRIRKRPEEYT